MKKDWLDELTDEIIGLERAARADEQAFYLSQRHNGAAKAAKLARLLGALEQRLMRLALGSRSDTGAPAVH